MRFEICLHLLLSTKFNSKQCLQMPYWVLAEVAVLHSISNYMAQNIQYCVKYRTRAIINHSQIVTAPFNFHWKKQFLICFSCHNLKAKIIFFLLLIAVNEGALTVAKVCSTFNLRAFIIGYEDQIIKTVFSWHHIFYKAVASLAVVPVVPENHSIFQRVRENHSIFLHFLKCLEFLKEILLYTRSTNI